VKSIVVNINEQTFGMEMEESDCGECLIMFMTILAGTENARKYCSECLCSLCDSRV
jgi:hypothetical protein